MPIARSRTKRELALELERVQATLNELGAAQAAIRAGDVDAIVVQGPKGDQIFALQNPDNPYHILAEQMNEGSATLTTDGTILFCNRRMAEMVGRTPETVLGSSFASMLREQERGKLPQLLRSALRKDLRVERELSRDDGSFLPVRLSLSKVNFNQSDEVVVCLVATDLSELNRAKRELDQQAEVFELASDAIVIRGLDGRIRSWNRGAKDIYGWSAEEAVGKAMSDLLHSTYPEPWDVIQAELERTNGWEGEVHQTSRDGSAIVVASRWSLLRDEAGEPSSALIINRDISQKKAAEIALSESEAKFRTLAELMPQFVWMTTPEGLGFYFNQRWFAYTGLTPEQSFGTGWVTPFHLEDKQTAEDAWKQAIATGENYRLEGRLRGQDGSYRWFLMLGLPIRDSSGEIAQWFGTCTDINAAKLAEAEMEQSQRELQLRHKIAQRFIDVGDNYVFSKVLDLILAETGSQKGLFGVVQESGAVVYASSAGFEQRPPDDDPAHGCMVQDCPEKWDEIWALALTQKRSFYSNQSKVGSERPEADRMLAVPILFQGELVGQLGVSDRTVDYSDSDQNFLERVATNLAPLLRTRLLWNAEETARKQAEMKLRELNKELDSRVQRRTSSLIAANKELEAFSYSVSHDLRAPLRHVDGFITLLSKRSYAALDQPSQHYLECASEAARRMGRLIDELLQFSHLGRSAMREEPVDLNALIDEIRRELEPELLDRSIVWNVSPLPMVAGDPGMLRQVIQNLLGNAIKFTRRCPIAEIAIGSRSEPGGEVVFFVRDNGAGFDMQFYEKMFQVFQRLHSEKDFEGTGIGLAIVRRIIERQGGRIWAEGAVEKGATIYFALPSRGSKPEGHNEIEADLAG